MLARNMSDPGPDPTALKTLLSIATRVPDHGKLTPWRLVVVQDDDRKELGDIAAQEPGVTNAEPNAVEAARGSFCAHRALWLCWRARARTRKFPAANSFIQPVPCA